MLPQCDDLRSKPRSCCESRIRPRRAWRPPHRPAQRRQTPRAIAEADRNEAFEAARQNASAQITAAETERDAVVTQARGEADRRVSTAEADRDQALASAGQAEQAAWLAQQEAVRAGSRRCRPGGEQPGRRRCGEDAGRIPCQRRP
jgi:hypothetical protein